MSSTNNKLEMPFWSHVEELRSRLLKSLFSVIIFSAVAFIYSDLILDFLKGPIEPMIKSNLDAVGNPENKEINLQVLGYADGFMVYIYVSLIVGLMFSIPVILYQIWKFVSPAINRKLSFITFIMFSMSTVFFAVGAYFSYKTILPVSISFFTSITGNSDFEYNITMANHLSFSIWMMLIGGLIFQLPIISIILKKLGIIDHHLLKRGRRYSILGIFIFAALLTPPDPFSQILFAVPLLILYEISIIIISFMK